MTASTAAHVRSGWIGKSGRALMRFPRWRGFGILCGLVILMVIIGMVSPQFFTAASILELVRGSALTAVIACGMVFLLSMQEIDLSVGSTYALSMVSGALAVSAGIEPWIAIVIAIVAGAFLGLVNGALSVMFRLPLILITLGTLSVYRGIVYIITGGSAIASLSGGVVFDVLGGSVGGVSTMVILLVVVVILSTALYHLTPMGVRIRAIGSNKEAARFSGMPISRSMLQGTTLVGLLAGTCGALMLAFFQNADPSVGTGLELQVLAAAILGGTALSGGSGSAIGAVIGAVFLNAINTALIYLGLPSTFSTFVTGLVIVLAVGLDSAIRGGALSQVFKRR